MLPPSRRALALALVLLAPLAAAQAPAAPSPQPPPGFECSQPLEECFPDLLPTNPGAHSTDETAPTTICTDFLNIGEAPTATPFRVTLYVDQVAVGEQQFSKTYQRGEGEANICVGGLRLAAGYHTMEAVVDPHNELIESDERNNRRSVRFFVGRTPQVDLELTWLRVTPTFGGENENQIFSINVTNRGSATSNATTVELVDGNGLNVTLPLLPLAAGKSVTLAHATRPELRPPGTFIARATVDPDGSNTEISERNNDAFVEYTILDHPMPDLTIVDVQISGNTTEFRGLLANVTVQNVGNKTVRGNLVRAINETNDTVAEARTLSYMPPNSTNTLQLRLVLRAGDRVIRLVADPYQLAAERNESNNEWVLLVTIDPPPIEIKGPNLVVQRVYAMPSDPRPNEAVSVGALVQNVGNMPAGPSVVNFSVDGVPLPDGAQVPALAPNASYAAYAPWRGGAAGAHVVTAQADGAFRVTELDETDNALDLAFFVGAPPEPPQEAPPTPTPTTPTPTTPTPATPTPTPPTRPTPTTPTTPAGPRIVIGQVMVETRPEPGVVKGIISASLRNPNIQPLGLLTVQFKVGDELVKEVLVNGLRGAATTVATTGEVELPEGEHTVRAEVRVVGTTDAPVVREERYTAQAAPKEGIPAPAVALVLAVFAGGAVLARKRR